MKLLLIVVTISFASFGVIFGANTHTLQEAMAEKIENARQQETVKWIIRFTPKQLSEVEI